METFRRNAIIYTICEIRFQQGALWDATLLGPIYDRIKSEYPRKEDVHGLQFQENIGAVQPRPSNFQPLPTMQFLNSHGTRAVQVGRNLLGVLTLGANAYTTWEDDYRPTILKMLTEYADVATPGDIVRIGLRYINRFDIPPEPFDPSHLLHVYPNVPETFERKTASFEVRVHVPISGSDQVTVVSGVNESGLPARLGLILDIDSVIDRSLSPMNVSDIEASLEDAHSHLETVFLESVTATTLAWLRAEKDYGLL